MLFGFQKNSLDCASSHLNLGSVAVIRRVEHYDFLSFIDETHEAAVKAFNSALDSDDVGLGIDVLVAVAVVLGDGVNEAEGPIRADILVVSCISQGLPFLVDSVRFST